jgi:hypothetical protein
VLLQSIVRLWPGHQCVYSRTIRYLPTVP